MSLTVTVTDHWSDTKRIHVIGTLAVAGNYATGGDTLNFATYKIKSSKVPTYLSFNMLSKYLPRFVYGTTIANGKLLFIVPDTGLELAAAAYPAALLADAIEFYGIFKK